MDGISQNLAAVLEWILSLPEFAVYIFLFFSALTENLFPPWPSDVIIIFSGFLSSYGGITPAGAFLASLAGNASGGMIMYFFGWRIFNRLNTFQHRIHADETHGIRHFLFRFLSAENLEKAKVKFEKRGFGFVLISRFFPGIRFFVSIVAGMSAMNFRMFALSFSAGSFVWGGILIYAGYALGASWQTALEYFKLYNYAAIALIFLFTGGYLILKKRRAGINK